MTGIEGERRRKASSSNPGADMLTSRDDPGLIDGRCRTGSQSDFDQISAGPAVAVGDEFGAWLVRQAGQLPEDFELAL